MNFGKDKDGTYSPEKNDLDIENPPVEDSETEVKSTRDEAEKKLHKWADCLGLDTKRQLFKDILEKLTGDVEAERLSFNEETEVFTYKLLKALPNKELVTIKETDFKQKSSIQKFGENEDMDAAALMMAKHTNLTSGEVQQLKTRDQKRLNAVIMGFLSQ